MMPYCTSDDIAGEFKDLSFTTSTTVKKATVDQFIAEADAYINSKLSRKYVTPITGTEALLVIKMISRAIVLRRVRPILKTETGDPKTSMEASGTPKTDPEKMLNDIIDGTVRLTDAVAAGGSQGIRSYTSENGITPTFTRDTESW
jgi:hypothetical protein